MQAKIHSLKIISAYPKALQARIDLYNEQLSLLDKYLEEYKTIYLNCCLQEINSIFNVLTCKLFCEDLINIYKETKELKPYDFFLKSQNNNFGFSNTDLYILYSTIYRDISFYQRTYKGDINKIKSIYNSACHSTQDVVLDDDELSLFVRHFDKEIYR